VLQSLLEGGGGARRTGGAGGNTGASRVQGLGGGAGGGSSGADVAIANIFRIEAYPDSNRLIVVSKTPDNFKWLDELVAEIDRPLQAGMPKNIPLKHASAVELSEILNALLAQSGSTASIRAPEEGLSGIDFNVASGGANGSSNTNAFTSGNTNLPGGGGGSSGIQFPWQSGRGAGDTTTEVSALVGKSRVVPNAGQNSLLILAPPEIQESLATIVRDLDQPGRQVMISVVLAEVQLGDDFQLGIKWGQGVGPVNPNNAVVAGTTFDGEKSDIFPPDLSKSVFAFGIDTNVVLQALSEETSVRILQQPRVFTSDNKEAKFFQGQDVPFQSSSLSDLNTGGGVNATFDQIPVGIGLNVRPRITKDRNVNMEIEVLLSNINVTSPEGVGGNPIVDRRQTNTTVTVKNNQTIVLSGIRKETENKIKSKMPLLGDVPVLDWVFANTSETKAVTELLVFVTPTVVDNPDENDSNYNSGERTRLRELAKPIADMSKELIKKRDLLSSDTPETAGPGEPLAPIDIPADTPWMPTPVAPSTVKPGSASPVKPETEPVPEPVPTTPPSTAPVPR
jgi:general secretion pathway protein D